jgi:hypothetical protein
MHGVSFDHLGYIRKGPQEIWTDPIEYTWKYLEANRLELMQELNVDQLIKKYQ